MKEINPIYVTFEQAKSFYNKGLEREVLGIKSNSVQKPYYNDKGELNGDCSEHIKKVLNYEKSILYPAPEQWQVVEWLRVNHGIWVSCYPTPNPLKCQFRIYKNPNGVMSQIYDDYMGKEFNSPQKAYSEAFDYILKNWYNGKDSFPRTNI